MDGVRVGTAAAGIGKRRRPDVALFAFDAPAATAATFTRNRFVAAPVTVARRHMESGRSRTRAWVVNSGNANCGTGRRGLRVAADSCARAAGMLGARPEQVLPFSTGVIMEQLSAEALSRGIDRAASKLDPGGWQDAARAIMTTDTRPKGASVRMRTRKGRVTITGIAKGSGMIHPDMATMLSFIATDAGVSAPALRRRLREAVSDSFNAISVDGDTSTNDAVALAATGAAGKLTPAEERRFAAALSDLCADLANQIVADGEGATMTATVAVRGLRSDADCRRVADSVACSPLVKTMLNARDPNLGRLLMAIGKAGVDFDPDAVSVRINGQRAYGSGRRAASFTEKAAKKLFDRPPLLFEIAMGKGRARAAVTFSDLSREYVRINAEYRT